MTTYDERPGAQRRRAAGAPGQRSTGRVAGSPRPVRGAVPTQPTQHTRPARRRPPRQDARQNGHQPARQPPRRPGPPRPRLPLGQPARRLRISLVVVLLLLAAIGVRLVQVQAFESKSYTLRAEQQRMRKVDLPALRGEILDRSGAVLAESVDATAIYADPKLVVDPQRTAEALSPVIGVPIADLLPKLTAGNRFQYLAHYQPAAVARQVTALNLPGIGELDERHRVYPGGTLAANLVGFVGSDGKGLGGLEYQLNSMLSGTDGEQTMQVGLTGTPIPAAAETTKQAVPGRTVQLTIDRDIQWYAQQAIAAEVRKTGAASGSVIVLDPRTGELLAVATAPAFDPNHLSTANPADLGDPAVADSYEPGSVNKVITFSAALQEGLVTPTTAITVPPTYTVADQVFHDAETHGTEHLTATGVLAKSSNIGTIQVAQRLGKQRLYHYLRAFGFGQKTGIDVPEEQAGLLPAPDQWSGTSLPTISFGQGISVTALQVADVYATIANHGVFVQPRLVAGTVDGNGVLHASTPAPRHRVVSARVAREVSDMLEAVTTNEGTAPAARIEGYRIAGKTGTAQRPDGHGGYSGYTASFVGYAPADAPQLVVEVVLQKPVHGHFGGEVAAPVFHDVMSYALAVRHIAPTGTKAPVAQLIAR